MVHGSDRITQIYGCATMWHENKGPILQNLISPDNILQNLISPENIRRRISDTFPAKKQ
jgi:hypothetical protein